MRFVAHCIYLLVCKGIRFIPRQTNMQLRFCDNTFAWKSDRRSYFAQSSQQKQGNGDELSTSKEIDHRPDPRGQFIMIS